MEAVLPTPAPIKNKTQLPNQIQIFKDPCPQNLPLYLNTLPYFLMFRADPENLFSMENNAQTFVESTFSALSRLFHWCRAEN